VLSAAGDAERSGGTSSVITEPAAV